MNHDRDELDNLIDGALPAYSDAEPLEGLERRVLERVRLAGAARRRGWVWRFGLSAPVAAMLVLVAVVTWHKPVPDMAKERPRAAVPQVAVARPAPEIRAVPRRQPAPHQVAESKPTRVAARAQSAGTRRPLPKKDVFPTPSPLTSEERALVAWAERAPDEVVQAFADLRARADKPVSIEPIHIEPLESDGGEER